MSLLKSLLNSKRFLLNVEMCPPRMDLPLEQSIEAWIDSNYLMRKVTSLGRFVFMTDGAIGRREEPNLRHVTINLGSEAERSRIIPILTTKHSLQYCLEFAKRSYLLGFTSLVVLGGDKSADFYMAQIVSHYQSQSIDEFLNETVRLGVKIPGIFGVFYYRSANANTLALLSKFFPVPLEGLKKDFEVNQSPDEICALSVHALFQRGLKNVYISNLPTATGAERLNRMEARVQEMLVVS